MSTRPLTDPAPGEFLLAVAPLPQDGEVASWRRRINGFAGRALAADALTREQDERSGRLALLAQALSAGVVDGLDAALDAAGATLHVAPGLGLAASGEDVRLTRPVAVALASLPVFESAAPPPDAPPDTLRPRRLGRSLAELRAAGTALPPALLLLLVPACFDSARRGDPNSPCERDDDAFIDLTRFDASRLALYPWPTDALALPAPGARWRNRLARALFLAEKNLAPGELAPWQAEGVPLALLGFDAAALADAATIAQAQFIDRHALRRVGGRPPTRATLLPDAAHPYLCEARMRQFADQLNDALAASGDVATAAAEFLHLPPAGLLPRAAVDFASGRQSFLPAGFMVDAVPIPLEQLDTALAEAATLAAFSTDRAERAQILVPVPQTVYEPGLLVSETLDPEFQTTLTGLLTRRGVELARRGALRERLSALARAVDGQAPAFPDPDPQALEAETASADALDPPEADFGTVTDAAGARGASDLAALIARLDAGPVKAQFTRGTLTIALAEVGLVAYLAELRQLADEADDKVGFGYARARLDLRRLKSVLDPAAADSDEILASDAGHALVSAQNNPLSPRQFAETQATLSLKPVADAAPASGTAPASGASASLFVRRASFNRSAALAANSVPLTARSATLSTGAMLDASLLRAETIATFVPPFSLETGLARPPAVSSFDQAKSGRVDTVDTLAGLTLNLGGLQFFGLADSANNDQPFDLGALRERPDAARSAASALAPDAANESGHLTGALLAVDETLAVWRQVASRIAQYRAAIADGEAVLAALRSQTRAASTRLAEIEAELAEARHDVAVARALIAEEEARIAELNARRAQVLAENVAFLAFRRVRVAEVFDNLPERALDPAFTVDPVPACRAADAAPPPELEAMLDVVRRAPPAWFPAVEQALARAGRIEQLGHLLERVRTRPAATPLRFSATSTQASRLLAASLSRVSARPATLRPDLLPNWSDARAQASEQASLADVIAAGGKAAASAANETLDALGDIGACLYRGFSATPARLRLDWAEALSEFDAAVELAQLARLSGFSGLDFSLRRTLQTLVDALYARIDPTRLDARALISDLVRVCLLAAAHAPVKRIVAARVASTAPATPGMRIPLLLDPSRARVGMTINFYAGSVVVAQGVLDDLDATGGAARVIRSFGGAATLAANALAQLVD